MDFLDPIKRRNHTIRLFIGYGLVAIAVILATTILSYYAYGFGVTRDGALVQRGLVFVSSRPADSQLFVDGERQDNTNAKLNLAAGRYNLSIEREGYFSWERRIAVDGGGVHHYVYPLLIPRELTTETVDSFTDKPVFMSQSRDNRWLVLQEALGDTFAVYDLNRDQAIVGQSTPLAPPTDIVSASSTPARYEIEQWSTNNRHMLLKRFYTPAATAEVATPNETFEYILLDRQRPEGSYNITREFSMSPAMTIMMRDNKPEQYYLYDQPSQQLFSATLDNPEPELEIENVISFKDHDADRILYVTKEDADDGQVRVMLRESDRTYFIRQISESDVYLLDIARYDGSWYVVAGSQADDRVYLFEDPVRSIRSTAGGRAASTFSFPLDSPTKVSFSRNAQFVMVQNGSSASVYDSENNRAYRYDLPYVLDGPEDFVEWMDGHRLSYVSGGQQIIFDYDNINQHRLSAANETFGGFYDRDTRYLYTITSAVQPATDTADESTTWQLTSTPLLIEADL